jgi:hypothetical protein
VGKRSDVIFPLLPPYLDFVAVGLRKLGHNVFYLRLSDLSYPPESEQRRASELEKAGILALPLETVSHLSGILSHMIDPENKIQEQLDQLAPEPLLLAFAELYPNNVDMEIKLRALIRSIVTGQSSTVGHANLWARAHPDRKHLLVYFRVSGLLAFGAASNVRLIIIPVEMIYNGVVLVGRSFRLVWRRIAARLTRSSVPVITPGPGSRNNAAARVVYVTHAGLSYGKLFEKKLFYSEQASSELHPDNLLHFDYSDTPNPSPRIAWVSLRSRGRRSFPVRLRALRAAGRRIAHVRSPRQLIGLALLAKSYLGFRSYVNELAAYPKLKLALIDYDILCPKTLLLALEARGIKTLAAQERFFASFYAIVGTILDTYLCASDYVAEVMKKSPSYYARRYVPVGQYRSDKLITAGRSAPPGILTKAIANGRRIITALGFHTHAAWHEAQADPFLNWTAHRAFLNDMIHLSHDIPNVFIVLRFKDVDWLGLPAFAEVVQTIEASENIAISTDYEQLMLSYDLCAHSDLVIAKHTSLGDECLSVGIPVLFHEYTHNSDRLVGVAFDYGPARIMCFNYTELLARSRAVLSDDPQMAANYEYLKTVIYGGLGDGEVRNRIHSHIESLVA